MQWHGEVHRQLGQRTLHFWFLRQPELYKREKKFEQLVDCMHEVGCVAYAGYELSGEFDILLRLWLPLKTVGQFAELVKEKVRPSADRNYSVIDPVRHWVWSENGNGGGPIVECDVEALGARTTPAEIAALNRLSEASHLPDYAIKPRNSREAAVFERFRTADAVRAVDANPGLRLVLRLRPNDSIENEDMRKTIRGIAAILDGLNSEPDPAGAERGAKMAISDLSMYCCADSTIIVLCRIHYEGWHLFRDKLLTPLAEIPGLTQTTTYPALSQNLVVSREAIALDDDVRDLLKKEPPRRERIIRKVVPEPWQRERDEPEADPPDPIDLSPPPEQLAANEFFDREEGETFEAKGSAFAPLESWLARPVDAGETAGMVEEKGFFAKTIAKSVVAMMNTRGGVILVGVLEADRYERHSDERLRLRLQNRYPKEGRFRLLGLQDPIYRTEGWDGFDRKFQRQLKAAVEGTTVNRVFLFPGWHDGRWFALIGVRPPSSRGRFYLKDGNRRRFMVRLGGSNEELHGTDADDYVDRRDADREARPEEDEFGED